MGTDRDADALTLDQLIDKLVQVRFKHGGQLMVEVEGCDCSGFARGVELWVGGDAKYTMSRRDTVEIVRYAKGE